MKLLDEAFLLSALASHRAAQRNTGVMNVLRRKWARLRVHLWNHAYGSSIHPHARLSGGLRLPHPLGIVIHELAEVGEDCMIMQQVTIGQLEVDAAPSIGRSVYIGAGAKILGPIRIGDGARVGANAVVLMNVPAGATAVGVPARIV
jgi:serine O-acetyltransferase